MPAYLRFWHCYVKNLNTFQKLSPNFSINFPLPPKSYGAKFTICNTFVLQTENLRDDHCNMEKKFHDVKTDPVQKLIPPVLFLVLVILLVNMLLYQHLNNVNVTYGQADAEHNLCPQGKFRLGTLKNCSLWLSCQAMKEVRKLKRIGEGAVKRVG